MEEERTKASKEFHDALKEAKKIKDIRYHSYFSIFGNEFMEIWEYERNIRKNNICRIKNKSEVQCYRIATEELKKIKEV